MGASDIKRLRKFADRLVALGQTGSDEQKKLLEPVAKNVKAQIKRQIETGTGPTGVEQARTVGRNGHPGLRGRKLGNAVVVETTPTGVRVAEDASQHVDWLEAHQEGHTFAQRTSGAQRLAYNKRGQLVSWARFRRAVKKSRDFGGDTYGWTTKRGVDKVTGRSVTVAGGHTIGERTLPQRPIYPTSETMPDPWRRAIAEGVDKGLARALGKDK